MSFQLVGSLETVAAIDRLIKHAQREVVIVSPYFRMNRDATLIRALRAALERRCIVTMLVREKGSDLAEDVLHELADLGMNVKLVPYLHAKIYWSDAGAVVSSMNMLATSVEKSIESGLVALDDSARRSVFEFIERDVVPRHDFARPSMFSRLFRRGDVSKARGKEGYCVRCGANVPLNLDKPFCFNCYGAWAEFKNADYREKICHECGDGAATSMAKPLCRTCYA
jgi:hypothetical protein